MRSYGNQNTEYNILKNQAHNDIYIVNIIIINQFLSKKAVETQNLGGKFK
jgi:hypothetical protein